MPEAHKVKKNQPLSLVVRMTVAAGAIVWVLRGQDWAELGRVFQRMSLGYFALSLLTYAAGQVVVATRWWFLLRAQSIHIPILAAVKLHLLGLFYNNVMPGSVGGDFLRAWYVTKHTDRRVEGALSVFVDRLIGLAGMVIMAAVAYGLFMRGRLLEGADDSGAAEAANGGSSWHVGGVLALAAALVAILAGLLIHPAGRRWLRQQWGRTMVHGRSLADRCGQAIAVYCSRPLVLLGALALTWVAQSIVIVAFWVLGRNLGVEAAAKYYFMIFPATWVVAAVPISVAGLGVLEVGIVKLFTLSTAATAESALALAFCQRFVWILASLPGGIVHLAGAHLPTQFFIDAEKGVD